MVEWILYSLVDIMQVGRHHKVEQTSYREGDIQLSRHSTGRKTLYK
jgi:hypothetical protein